MFSSLFAKKICNELISPVLNFSSLVLSLPLSVQKLKRFINLLVKNMYRMHFSAFKKPGADSVEKDRLWSLCISLPRGTLCENDYHSKCDILRTRYEKEECNKQSLTLKPFFYTLFRDIREMLIISWLSSRRISQTNG